VTPATTRRQLLRCAAAAAAATLTGCVASAPRVPRVRVERLPDLLARAGLSWLVWGSPRELGEVPWLTQPIARILPDIRLSAFRALTGLELRRVPEAAVASYPPSAPPGTPLGKPGTLESTVYLVRHATTPDTVEKAFVERLVTDQKREASGGVVHVSGRAGIVLRSLWLVGDEIAIFQYGGDQATGPGKVASLYAQGKLKRSPTALANDPLRLIDLRLGAAAAKAYSLGPFDDEFAAGARGLLQAATGVGASCAPTHSNHLELRIVLTGDYPADDAGVEEAARNAWADIATRDSFGHLLGLDRPVQRAVLQRGEGEVGLTVGLDADLVSRGLAAATAAQIDEIMK
jgi:hypothetical protein